QRLRGDAGRGRGDGRRPAASPAPGGRFRRDRLPVHLRPRLGPPRDVLPSAAAPSWAPGPCGPAGPGTGDGLIRLGPLVRPLVELRWTRMVAEINGVAKI